MSQWLCASSVLLIILKQVTLTTSCDSHFFIQATLYYYSIKETASEILGSCGTQKKVAGDVHHRGGILGAHMALCNILTAVLHLVLS